MYIGNKKKEQEIKIFLQMGAYSNKLEVPEILDANMPKDVLFNYLFLAIGAKLNQLEKECIEAGQKK